MHPSREPSSRTRSRAARRSPRAALPISLLCAAALAGCSSSPGPAGDAGACFDGTAGDSGPPGDSGGGGDAASEAGIDAATSDGGMPDAQPPLDAGGGDASGEAGAGDDGGAPDAGGDGATPTNVFVDTFDNIPGWDRQGVVLATSLGWEATLMQDPSVVYGAPVGPTFQMWYGSLTHIGYATSTDGKTWTKNPSPVVSPTLDSEQGALNQPSVVYQNGLWHMTYFGVGSDGVGRIHYAEASDPAGPWNKSGPVLVPTEAWEDNWIYNSSLLYDAKAGLWKMWYTAGKIASAGGEPQFICYATASDPKGPWTKYAGNPIVHPMNDGGWASLGIGGPNVRVMPDGSYKMVVVGWQADYPSRGGQLSSADGLTWDLSRSSMTLDLGVVSGPEPAMIYREYVVSVNGTDYVYYNAKNNDSTWTETIEMALWNPSLAIIDPSKWAMTQDWQIPNGASYSVQGGRAASLGNATSGQSQTLQGNVAVPGADYALTADVTPMSATLGDRDTVLLLRSMDRSNYYYAGVASWNAQYAIGKLVNGTNTRLASVGAATDIQPNVTHHLTFSAVGSTLELSDNGAVVLTTTDSSLAPTLSYVGLQTTTATGLSAFDNVSVDRK